MVSGFFLWAMKTTNQKQIHAIAGVPTHFNFTHALDGGAWLRTDAGIHDWFSFSVLRDNYGQAWIERQLKAQGWMTGCEIKVA